MMRSSLLPLILILLSSALGELEAKSPAFVICNTNTRNTNTRYGYDYNVGVGCIRSSLVVQQAKTIVTHRSSTHADAVHQDLAMGTKVYDIRPHNVAIPTSAVTKLFGAISANSILNTCKYILAENTRISNELQDNKILFKGRNVLVGLCIILPFFVLVPFLEIVLRHSLLKSVGAIIFGFVLHEFMHWGHALIWMPILFSLFAPRQLIAGRGKDRGATINRTRCCAEAEVDKGDESVNNHQNVVNALSKIVPHGINMSDIDMLRFALAYPNDELKAVAALKKTVEWRQSAGKSIIEAAQNAVTKATLNFGWEDDDAIRNAAPHANVINKFITSKAVITIGTEGGDLVSVIRASQIDSTRLMDSASVEQVCDYFLYANEVHRIVANKRSETSGRLCTVVVANDITGSRKFPDKRFNEALKLSRDQCDSLYPSLTGPTLILNMPCAGLVKSMSLFPESVHNRLIFKKAPVLASLEELTPLGEDTSTRALFLSEVKDLLN